MPTCSCSNWFKAPDTEKMPEEYYIYCPKCRSSTYGVNYSEKEYVCGNVTNPVNGMIYNNIDGE